MILSTSETATVGVVLTTPGAEAIASGRRPTSTAHIPGITVGAMP